MRKSYAVATITAVLAASMVFAEEKSSNGDKGSLGLSAGLTELLREEMREITEGVRDVTVALSAGDWKTIVETSEKIRASYILDQKLSEEQKEELREKLPFDFIKLDEAFHARAGKLGAAAANRDADLAAYHFYRMVESCAVCHAAYAETRFPGFSSESKKDEGHHHH